MGFFDKIKDAANRIKEDNKNFGSTMKRMNNRTDFYGNINRGVKDGDFWEGSYINIENGKGLIYSTSKDDYVFDTIASFEICGNGPMLSIGNDKVPSTSCIITFVDGKKAKADIITQKLATFKMTFNV